MIVILLAVISATVLMQCTTMHTLFISGKVYNITPYMKFHPGGVDDLMKAAGIDCTIPFDEVNTA